MKTVRAHEHGDPVVLQPETIERPEPGPDEVLVRTVASSVNVIDCLIRRGIVPESMDATLPWVPGWDFSGEVKSTGAGVTDFSSGDAVYGMAQQPRSGETYAEFCTIPARELEPKPDGLSHREAAALPMAALTAHHALFEVGALEADETVLIHAAAGGVGHLAVQMANNTGATVVGTASETNRGFLKDLGVDEVINYREESFEKQLESLDLVIDAIGDGVLKRSIEIVESGGTVVTLPQPPTEKQQQLGREKSVSVEFFSITSTATPVEWQRINEHVRNNVLSPTVSNTYPLDRAADAHRESEEGHVRGKLVLKVSMSH